MEEKSIYHSTKEDIQSFLSGSNPFEHIIKIECDNSDNEVTIIYRDENYNKQMMKDDFKPFCWCTQRVAREMYNGDRNKLKSAMAKYGISCRGLITARSDGRVPERMANGFNIMFFATEKMSYRDFMKFFKEAGVPIYPREGDKNYDRVDYVVVAPAEQYMIQTGKRLFKGYDDYDELLRMEWDLETEGLDPNKCMISQIGIRTNQGYEKIIPIDGEGDEKYDNELEGILQFFSVIKELSPDILTGHNTENFDWNFIDVRLRMHGLEMSEVSKDYFPKGVYKKNKENVLKLGGEIEYFKPTVMWGTNITDSLFAVRRAQALDSNMKKADLKYVTKYSDLNKPNRVYVPGKKINDTWVDNSETYAFNDENGIWFKVDDKVMSRTYIEVDVNGNDIRSTRFELNGKNLLDKQDGVNYQMVSGRYIVERYLLDDLYETDKVEARYNQSNYLVGKMLPVSYEKMCTMGTATIWKYLMLAWSYEHGIAIPEPTKKRPFTGGLSRLITVGYSKNVVKNDYNSLYPSIILTFKIKTEVDITDAMLSLLEYILTQREYYKGLKGKYGKEANKLEDELANMDKSHPDYKKLKEKKKECKRLKSQYDKMQLPLKIVGNSFFGSFAACGTIFYWSDMDCAEKTTCIGRQMFRLLISWFKHLGYQPIVGDTDGINFKVADNLRYTDEHPYISNGKGRNTEKGKAYTSVRADVAEFEDLFLTGKNGLDIDEFVPASVYLKRKNYADLLDDGKMKLVGNTLKSKKMPLYIEKFIDTAMRMLLEGRGKDFLDYYYDYIEKIYNLQIPLNEIASVGKIKTSIEDYKKNCNTLTSAGNKRARQAWYELAIKHGLNVNMGDAIYYINTGDKKSSSDVQRITKYFRKNLFGEDDVTKDVTKEYKTAVKNGVIPKDVKLSQYVADNHKDIEERDELIFNCVMIPNTIMEDEESEHLCDENFEYNVDKYIEMFNKRISGLAVCFHPSIRYRVDENGKTVNNLFISNPSDRKYFTEQECELVAGMPLDIKDQDSYEDIMRMEDKEIRFWTSVNEIPPYVEECGMNWDEIVRDYNVRQEELRKEGIRQEVELYNLIIGNMTQEQIDEFEDDGTLPDTLMNIVEEGKGMEFVSKKYGVAIGTIYDIIDREPVGDGDSTPIPSFPSN